MKLKNKDFKAIKVDADEAKNNYKGLLMQQVLTSPLKGMTMNDFIERKGLIDALNKCTDVIELEKATWKLLKEIIEGVVWFQSPDGKAKIMFEEAGFNEMSEFLQEIKKI